MKRSALDAIFQDNDSGDASHFFARIPLIHPRRAFKILEKYGYRGQSRARRAMCLTAYRHVKRLKQIYLHQVPRESLPPKSNVLLMGPTGCGKTFLIELLFQHILKLPTVIVDITGFSETGYIGEDTKSILTRLLLATDGNPIKAAAGVVCLDEFDKLAASSTTNRFDGQGTTKDVSGYGVQRELLKMLESTFMEVPVDSNNSLYAAKQKIFTGDITFIAAGTFSGFKGIPLWRNQVPRIGFQIGQQPSGPDPDKIAVQLDEAEIEDIENFHIYGFMPELIGRFSRIIPLAPLDKETLRRILIENVVKKFQAEFQAEGLELRIEPPVLKYIVEKSFARQTGARGLGTLLTRHIEDAAFRYFGYQQGTVVLKLHRNQVVTKFTP